MKGLDFDTRPQHGQSVTILCTGRLQDGSRFLEETQMTFILGDGDVIQGSFFFLNLPGKQLTATPRVNFPLQPSTCASL